MLNACTKTFPKSNCGLQPCVKHFVALNKLLTVFGNVRIYQNGANGIILEQQYNNNKPSVIIYINIEWILRKECTIR